MLYFSVLPEWIRRWGIEKVQMTKVSHLRRAYLGWCVSAFMRCYSVSLNNERLHASLCLPWVSNSRAWYNRSEILFVSIILRLPNLYVCVSAVYRNLSRFRRHLSLLDRLPAHACCFNHYVMQFEYNLITNWKYFVFSWFAARFYRLVCHSVSGAHLASFKIRRRVSQEQYAARYQTIS